VLAEVLLSGLIVKVGGSPDRPEYDFILGARVGRWILARLRTQSRGLARAARRSTSSFNR